MELNWSLSRSLKQVGTPGTDPPLPGEQYRLKARIVSAQLWPANRSGTAEFSFRLLVR